MTAADKYTLRNAFIEAELLDFAEADKTAAAIKELWTPSARFLRRMKRIIKEERLSHNKYINTPRRHIIYVAAVVTAILISTISVFAVGISVRDMIIERGEEYYRVMLNNYYTEYTQLEQIEAVYGFETLPDGYKIESYKHSNTFCETILVSDDASLKEITLTQYLRNDSVILDIDSMHSQIDKIDVNGIESLIRETKLPDGNIGKAIYFTNDDYIFILSFNYCEYSNEQLKDFAESVTKIEPAS